MALRKERHILLISLWPVRIESRRRWRLAAILVGAVARRVDLPPVQETALNPRVVVHLGAPSINRKTSVRIALAHDSLEHAAVAADVNPIGQVARLRRCWGLRAAPRRARARSALGLWPQGARGPA